MKTSEEARAALDALTWEQRELAVLMASGMGVKEVAYRRKVPLSTTRGQLYSLYSVLGIKKAAQLGVIVGLAGLVTDWRTAA